MVRNLEKIIKIHRPTELSEMKLETLEVCPTFPTIDLVNIEPFTETGLAVHVDLGLDQIEEQEE